MRKLIVLFFVFSMFGCSSFGNVVTDVKPAGSGIAVTSCELIMDGFFGVLHKGKCSTKTITR